MNTPKTLLALIVVLGLGCTLSHASTYYVRTDGGSSTQCTGLANAAYPGSGVGMPCAFNHPVWALGAKGTTGKLLGGDTLIIDDTNRATGAQAQYKIGYGMPNTVSANCYLNWTYDCVMSAVPSGPDAAHPTKIVGSSYNSGCTKKPQLWGTDGVAHLLNLSNRSNIEVSCMELTDHSNCGLRVGSPLCAENWNKGTLSGPFGRNGIFAQGGSNFTFTNLDVHGLASAGFHMGGINSITFSKVNMDGNYSSNWNGDVGSVGTTSYNSGNIILDQVKNRFAGCSEAYPRSASFTSADYSNCADQNDAGNPGYGDGIGMYRTGGNWIITNSDISHNTQDGLDLLYHDSTGFISIQRSLFEGNNGNQIKTHAPNVDIQNSVIISNCNYLKNTNKVKNTTSWSSCRAGGDAIAMSITKGGIYKILNSTIYSDGNSGVMVANSGSCDGTEKYTFRNNINVGNGMSSMYIRIMPSTCSVAPLDTDYTNIYNVSSAFCPSGSHNKCNTDPKWVAPISQTADSNVPNIALQSTSPALGSGLVIAGVSSLDYLGVDRGTAAWSMGAINKASTAAPVVGSTSATTTTPPVITKPVPATTTTTTTTTNTTTTASKPTTTTSTKPTTTVKPKWMSFVVKK